MKRRFICACCGACCRWPGIVRVDDPELEAIAAFLHIPFQQLIDEYTHIAEDRSCLSLNERPDGSCIFLEDDNRCRIHPVKPRQCAEFPYKWDVPPEYRALCHGHWEEIWEARSELGLVHVLGHPSLPMAEGKAPGDAQLFNCRNFCRMLSWLGVPFVYYGVPGTELPPGGIFASTGKATALRWTYRGSWHQIYNRRLTRLLAQHAKLDERPEVIASLYGAAQSDINALGLPVVEPMVGYDHCWAPYRVFPSYAQQSVLYAMQKERTWGTRYFDTVIPHFLVEEDYWISKTPGNYLLYLGRNVPEKGIELARQCARDTGLELREEYDGWSGAAKTELLANARAVLMPTLYVEPFGYVAIEAQMCGTPVITTDWGAFAETVIHGKTGFRCRTAAEFAKAANLAPQLSRQYIRQSALERFGMTKIAPLFEQYLLFVWNIQKNGGYYTSDAIRNRTSWPGSPETTE